MSEPETLYTYPIAPDPRDAVAVLAFLLVPESAFYEVGDDADTKAAVRDVLARARRDVLLQWYEHHTRRTP